MPFGIGVAIGTGVQFDHLCPDAVRRLDLALIGGDEDADAAARFAQRSNEMRQPVLLACDFKPAFGCPLFALFRHDADGMGFVA